MVALLTPDGVVQLGPKSILFSGGVVAVEPYVLNVTPAVFTLTAADVSLLEGYLLTVTPGSYAMTYSDVTMLVNGYLPVDSASGSWSTQSDVSDIWTTVSDTSTVWN